MSANLTTHFDAIQTSRRRLDALAARGSHIDTAMPHRTPGAAIRRSIGTALIRTGERMEGMPRPALGTAGTDLPATAATSR